LGRKHFEALIDAIAQATDIEPIFDFAALPQRVSDMIECMVQVDSLASCC